MCSPRDLLWLGRFKCEFARRTEATATEAPMSAVRMRTVGLARLETSEAETSGVGMVLVDQLPDLGEATLKVIDHGYFDEMYFKS